ncbi:MAG TPA: ABC transporter ATP-binding protein [Actinomycetota bacterium]|nr:ABC transporter ATP-binding protein [Actinomycetota bacterium]
MSEPVLSIRDLVVRLSTSRGVVHAVNGVSLDVESGAAVGLVGESGSGKSVTSLAILRLLPRGGRIVSGEVWFAGRDLTRLPAAEMRAVRGREIAMILQDPQSSLNPVLPVGEQIEEAIRAHEPVSRRAARARAIELLGAVGIARPGEQLGRFPHQFSGGMRQRVMIAIALALRPRLLIADEPTTALDVTVQAQVLELLRELTDEVGAAVVLISHDLGIMARMTRRISVMYAGRVVESAPTDVLFARPRHPYTVGLLHSIPRIGSERQALVPIEGAPPDLERLPEGCPFAPRCAWRVQTCWSANPPLSPDGTPEHVVACHNPVEPEEIGAGRPVRAGFTRAAPPGAREGVA